MKKLVALLTLLLLLLASTAYLYYTHWHSHQQRTAAIPYIPQSAALVYEVDDFNQQWEHFKQTSIGKEFSAFPPFIAIKQAMSWLKKDLLADKHKLGKVPLTLSLHQAEQGPLGCLFYFNTYDVATQAFLTAMMAQVKRDQSYHTTTRQFANSKIVSWGKEGTMQQLSYLKHKQYMIVSFSPSLIEEVAHGLASKKSANLVSLNKSESAHCSLYINLKQLSQLANTLIKPGQVKLFSDTLATLAQDGCLHLRLTPHCLLVSGAITAPVSSPKHLINTMEDQAPGPIQLSSYLPQNAAVLQHATFSQADQLWEAWQQYRAKSGVALKSPKDLFPATLFPLLQGEITHCVLSATQGHAAGQLVFMKVSDAQAVINVLKTAQALTPAGALSSQVHHLTSDYFQYSLPGLLFPAFKAAYCMQVDDYLLLADNQDTLAAWYTQYQQGKTWAKSPTKKAWLASILDHAHHTWFVDLPQAWHAIIQSLQPRWQQALKGHPAPSIDASLQLRRDAANECYMSILIKRKTIKQSQESLEQRITMPPTVEPAVIDTDPGKVFFQADAPLIHAPWLVKSHRNPGHYILLQDKRHQIYLLEPTGKLLWKKTLKGPITTKVFELDFYKNNKIQYLFATDQKLHLLDYYGREVRYYPQALLQPVQLQVVDYNQAKEYRLLLATAQGDIYLTDKQGRSLPGWNPRVLGHAFASTPFHLRVRGKDYFLALQTNGTLVALNRKGQGRAGFPVMLKAAVHTPLLVRKLTTGTVLTVTTDDGKQVTINLEGQIQKTTQLGRLPSTGRFIVCPNQASGDSYAILRQDANKIVVLDEMLNERFEVPYAKKELLAQYYGFEKGPQFYVLTNPEERLTYLYEHTGKQLLAIPGQNGYEVQLVFSQAKRQVEVYSSTGAKCVRYVLKR